MNYKVVITYKDTSKAVIRCEDSKTAWQILEARMKIDGRKISGASIVPVKTPLIYTLAASIDNIMLQTELGFSCDVEEVSNTLSIYIDKGDWKHEHNYADYLIEEFLNNINVKYDTWKDITEEDGSDCYSAIHYYKIIEGSD